jgi:hypothetical protein
MLYSPARLCRLASMSPDGAPHENGLASVTAPGDRQEIVVFIVRRDTNCAECGTELAHGSFLRVENQKALCLECADLDHLEYLPRGDTAITRRATKYTRLRAVVVQWSRSRKRYERQGILAEAAAIDRAEAESAADADVRARQQERAAERRAAEDQQYITQFAAAIRRHYPSCPAEAADLIARHACQKYSGRIGRSAAAKEFEPAAIRLAVIAHIRHVHTRYDEILMATGDRQLARSEIEDDVDAKLQEWAAGAATGAGA